MVRPGLRRTVVARWDERLEAAAQPGPAHDSLACAARREGFKGWRRAAGNAIEDPLGRFQAARDSLGELRQEAMLLGDHHREEGNVAAERFDSMGRGREGAHGREPLAMHPRE